MSRQNIEPKTAIASLEKSHQVYLRKFVLAQLVLWKQSYINYQTSRRQFLASASGAIALVTSLITAKESSFYSVLRLIL